MARSGQKSLAQGLPWVNSPTGLSPEGAGKARQNRLESSTLDLFGTWRIPSAVAAAVGILAAASIFVLRDAPGFLSDPILYLLTNR